MSDSPREPFHKHPWSIGGGGAAELKEQLEQSVNTVLGQLANAIGITAVTGEDELFMQPLAVLQRGGIEHLMELVEGNTIRDWRIDSPASSVWLYDDKFNLNPLEILPNTYKFFWQFRAAIYWRKRFGTPLIERGLTWYEWQELYVDKLRTPLSIAYAEVATHNHFVLDRGGKVFKQTAPVIKLPSDATEDDHLALLGLLNSSTACFWMKQVFHNKGSTVDDKGARQTTVAFENFYQMNGTGLLKFPIPSDNPLALATRLDRFVQDWQSHLPLQLTSSFPLSQAVLAEHKSQAATVLGRMIAQQEELDWQCYRLYGLIGEALTYEKEPPAIHLGQRAFEIVMARQMTAGTLATTWFERHGSTPITRIPADWPDDYRALVERRINHIETDARIKLIEQPEYKRRWNTEPWESQLERALRTWLLARLESYFDFDGRMNEAGTPTAKLDSALVSTARLADLARQDADFMRVGELHRDDPAFDVHKLVTALVEADSVPLLPVLRYKDTGLRKRAEWERTWEWQREEDTLTQRRQDAEPSALAPSTSTPSRESFKIPVPPKYTSADFQGGTYWRLRGKLDVPKERWVSFPHCEGEDGTLLIAWAGYDHLRLVRAVSAYYVDVQERLGGREDPRLVPLLACLIEVLPWLKQWHNDVDPEFGMSMGDYFEGFIQEEARQMGKTVAEIKAWQPPRRATRRGKK